MFTLTNNTDKDFNVTAFFPDTVRKAAMTQYGNEKKPGDPLQHLVYNETSLYLISIKQNDQAYKKYSAVL